jgi:hypothetical protein
LEALNFVIALDKFSSFMIDNGLDKEFEIHVSKDSFYKLFASVSKEIFKHGHQLSIDHFIMHTSVGTTVKIWNKDV